MDDEYGERRTSMRKDRVDKSTLCVAGAVVFVVVFTVLSLSVSLVTGSVLNTGGIMFQVCLLIGLAVAVGFVSFVTRACEREKKE